MLKIHLVDPDAERRTGVAASLRGEKTHIEPYTSVGEFAAFMPIDGYVLVRDENNAVVKVLEAIDAASHWMPVLGYNEAPDFRSVLALVRGGAVGYLAYPVMRDTLLAEISQFQNDVGPHGYSAAETMDARSRMNLLSARERDVVEALVEFGSSKEIARHLSISPRTVDMHRASAVKRMNAKNTADMIRIAIKSGITGQRH